MHLRLICFHWFDGWYLSCRSLMSATPPVIIVTFNSASLDEFQKLYQKTRHWYCFGTSEVMKVAEWPALWPVRGAMKEWPSVDPRLISSGGATKSDCSEALNTIQSNWSPIKFP